MSESLLIAVWAEMPPHQLSGLDGYVIQHGAQQAVNEIERLRAENEELWRVLTEIREQLYGQGFEVLGYHLNGNTEPLDNWFEGNEGWLESEVSDE